MAAAETAAGTAGVFVGLAGTAGTVGITGDMLGINQMFLMCGVFGAFGMMATSKPTSIISALSNIVIGAGLAGIGTPILVKIILHNFDLFNDVVYYLELCCATLIGATWQKGIPFLVEIVKEKFNIGGKSK